MTIQSFLVHRSTWRQKRLADTIADNTSCCLCGCLQTEHLEELTSLNVVLDTSLRRTHTSQLLVDRIPLQGSTSAAAAAMECVTNERDPGTGWRATREGSGCRIFYRQRHSCCCYHELAPRACQPDSCIRQFICSMSLCVCVCVCAGAVYTSFYHYHCFWHRQYFKEILKFAVI